MDEDQLDWGTDDEDDVYSSAENPMRNDDARSAVASDLLDNVPLRSSPLDPEPLSSREFSVPRSPAVDPEPLSSHELTVPRSPGSNSEFVDLVDQAGVICQSNKAPHEKDGLQLQVSPDSDESPSSTYFVGDWVSFVGDKTRCEDGMIGVVASLVPSEDTDVVCHMILSPCRYPKSSEAEADLRREIPLWPPPSLISLGEAKNIALRYDPPYNSNFPGSNNAVSKSDCAYPECSRSENSDPAHHWCEHPKEFFWRGGVFQHGLVVYTRSANSLERAPATIDPCLFRVLVQSQHPLVQASLFKMPLPSCWSFFKDENVRVVQPMGASHTGSVVPASCEGFVISAQGFRCKVRFSFGTFSVPSVSLVKLFDQGSWVDIPALGGFGSY